VTSRLIYNPRRSKLEKPSGGEVPCDRDHPFTNCPRRRLVASTGRQLLFEETL